MPDTRAVVAISEDRQFLCFKLPHPFINFCIAERGWPKGFFGWLFGETWIDRVCIEDAGQDANDVLAKFLEGRE